MVARILRTQLFCVIFCFQIVSPEVIAQGSFEEKNKTIVIAKEGKKLVVGKIEPTEATLVSAI